VALVTGATRGIGYYIGREIVRRLPLATTFMTARDSIAGFETMIGMELGAAARERTKLLSMDVRDMESVTRIKDRIVSQHGPLSILVNNAGLYLEPNTSPAVFPGQAKQILDTNYWGTKNVITAFSPNLTPHSRVVNITSNPAHSHASLEEADARAATKERFDAVGNECELDGLMMKFQRDVDSGRWAGEGWPGCAYSVSKLAINAYTRLLQDQFDTEGREDCVVNAVYPCTKHRRIEDKSVSIMDDEEGARFVFFMATVRPNSHGVFPRGAVIWNNSGVVAQDRRRHNYSKYQAG